MARPKSKGAYAPLAAQYYLDDAILEVGAEAELLFVRCLSFLASVASNGFITDRQVRVAAIGLRNVNRRIEALAESGLFVPANGGYQVRSWLKWNRTAEEIGRALAKDAERKRTKLHAADSELHADYSDLHTDDSEPARRIDQPVRPRSETPHKTGDSGDNSARNPNRFRTDSSLQSRAVQSSTEQSKDVAEIRPDVSRLCTVLADLIESNGSKRPTIGKAWLDAARLLLDNDHRPMAEALALIQWCQADPFWKANILSMPKFREKYDTLRLQRQTQGSAATRRPSVTEGNLLVVAEYANQDRLEIPQ